MADAYNPHLPPNEGVAAYGDPVTGIVTPKTIIVPDPSGALLPAPGVADASTGRVVSPASDFTGRTALVSDDAIAAILIELQVLNLILAQRCGVTTDDLAAMRNDLAPQPG
jgi:hypothetical protein